MTFAFDHLQIGQVRDSTLSTAAADIVHRVMGSAWVRRSVSPDGCIEGRPLAVFVAQSAASFGALCGLDWGVGGVPVGRESAGGSLLLGAFPFPVWSSN